MNEPSRVFQFAGVDTVAVDVAAKPDPFQCGVELVGKGEVVVALGNERVARVGRGIRQRVERLTGHRPAHRKTVRMNGCD